MQSRNMQRRRLSKTIIPSYVSNISERKAVFLTVNKGVKQTLKFRNIMFTASTYCEFNYILFRKKGDCLGNPLRSQFTFLRQTFLYVASIKIVRRAILHNPGYLGDEVLPITGSPQ